MKTSVFFFVAILIMSLTSSAFAQEAMGKPEREREEKAQPPMETPGMQGMMCPMCRMMVQNMMKGPGMMGMGPGPMMQEPGMMKRMPMMKPGMVLDLIDRLDLSKEQRDKIRDILASHRKDMIRRNADREIAEVELNEIMQNEEPNLDSVEEQIRKLANLEAVIKFSQIKVWLDARSVLTEEQRMNLKRIMEDRHTQMMGGKKAEPDRPGAKPGPKDMPGRMPEHAPEHPR